MTEYEIRHLEQGKRVANGTEHENLLLGDAVAGLLGACVLFGFGHNKAGVVFSGISIAATAHQAKIPNQP